MTMSELCERSVVNITNGANLGNVDDIVFNEDTAEISHVIIYGRLKWFGLMGRGEDTYIPWDDIQKVGKDVLLVNTLEIRTSNENHSGVKRMFG